MASIESLPPSPKTRVSPLGSRQYPTACRGKMAALAGSVTCPPPPTHAPGLDALSTGGGAEPCGADELSLLHAEARAEVSRTKPMRVQCIPPLTATRRRRQLHALASRGAVSDLFAYRRNSLLCEPPAGRPKCERSRGSTGARAGTLLAENRGVHFHPLHWPNPQRLQRWRRRVGGRHTAGFTLLE